MKNNLHTIGVFIDLSKAFDTLNHNILLDKLYSLGIRGIAHNWFRNYLENRTQYTQISSTHSDIQYVSCGVPQGSILGPLLFLLYINDLSSICKSSNEILFADDTTLLYSDSSLVNLTHKINLELNDISEWFAANKLSLNVEKTQFILFQKPRDNTDVENITLEINGKAINGTNFVKFLGVYIDEKMKWNEHISRKCSQISKAIGIMSKLKNMLPKQTLLTLYKSLVLPHMTYGVVAWGDADASLIKRITLLQKRAMRIINGLKYNSHTDPVFKSHKLIKFQHLYELECCKLYLKFC